MIELPNIPVKDFGHMQKLQQACAKQTSLRNSLLQETNVEKLSVAIFLIKALKMAVSHCRVFPRKLTDREIFNNRLLFENNKLLFYLLFSGNFC